MPSGLNGAEYPESGLCQRSALAAGTTSGRQDNWVDRRYRGEPRVYLLHEQWLRLDPDGGLWRSPSLAPGLLPLAGICARAGRLEMNDEALVVLETGWGPTSIVRVEPGLSAAG